MEIFFTDPEEKLKNVENEIKKITKEIQHLQGKKQLLMTKRDKIKNSILQQKSAKLANLNWDKTGMFYFII